VGIPAVLVAEHQGCGIASAATAVVMGHVAAGTRAIASARAGSCCRITRRCDRRAVGTLESTFPGRIDLGGPRAPGTDPRTSLALRRKLDADVDEFPQDVLELMEYFRPAHQPGSRYSPYPERASRCDWILGSSLYGARLAALLACRMRSRPTLRLRS